MSDGAAEPGPTLAAALAPERQAIETFADRGGLRLSNRLTRLWDELFPLILPPGEDDGLGVVLLNSNADTNFSFTNALGMIPAGQARRLTAAFDAYPKARWIVALHHHLIEYPMPVAAFSERIGTALVNGSWFQRVLKPYARRIVVMHGHRHVDWIGACGELRIVSAPSPVMAPDLGANPFPCPCAWAGAGRAPHADRAGADRPRRRRWRLSGPSGRGRKGLALRQGLLFAPAAEQVGDPAARWMMAAEGDDGDRDRDADEGAE